MKRSPSFLLIFFLFSCAGHPPKGVTDIIFGSRVEDPFRWLEDDDSREVKAWTLEQDRKAEKYLHSLAGRNQLIERFKKLSVTEEVSRPVEKGGRLFYTKQSPTEERAILYWKKGISGKEIPLLNPNEWIGDNYAALGGWVPSFDGEFVAYTVIPNNQEERTRIHLVRVVDGKEQIVDKLEGGKYALPGWLFQPRWHPDNSGFYYTYHPTDSPIAEGERQGHAEIRFHRLNTPQSEDQKVFAKTGDPKLLLDVDISRDGKWLFVTKMQSRTSNEILVSEARGPSYQFRSLFQQTGGKGFVFFWKGKLFLHTNWGAPNYRLLVAPFHGKPPTSWNTLVPERKNVTITGGLVFENHIVLRVSKNASTNFEIYSLGGKFLKSVVLPGLGSVSWLSGDVTHKHGFFVFESYTSPPIIYRLSISSGKLEPWYRSQFPFDPQPYLTEQVFFPSKDGTKISMFIVRKRKFLRDGKTPFQIYGYGAWGDSLEPSFMFRLVEWLEAGGGYAEVNVRGGGEYGENWHFGGTKLKKQNSFDDFIAAAEYLIGKKYASPDRLAARGASFGGLLVAGALVQRPDLFKAVLCEVPVIDMVRYHLSGIGRNWSAEFGTAENEAEFKSLHSYSPYHNLRESVSYPAVLLTVGENDERVKGWHAKKFFARLSKLGGEKAKGPILLRVEHSAGHGGPDTASEWIKSLATKIAFLMEQVGLNPQ